MLHIQDLIDDAKCYAQMRRMRWPECVCCPHCEVLPRTQWRRNKRRLVKNPAPRLAAAAG